MRQEGPETALQVHQRLDSQIDVGRHAQRRGIRALGLPCGVSGGASRDRDNSPPSSGVPAGTLCGYRAWLGLDRSFSGWPALSWEL